MSTVCSDRKDRALPELRLRAISDSDGALLEALASPAVTGPWDTYDDPPSSMLNGRDFGGGSQVVELPDGTAIGTVSWIQIPYGPNRRSMAWSIGITLLPEHRGQRYGASAQYLLTDQLFQTSDANRVQAMTDVGNVGEQRSLERAGFTLEGVVRGCQWRDGAWHDGVLYGRLRADNPPGGRVV